MNKQLLIWASAAVGILLSVSSYADSDAAVKLQARLQQLDGVVADFEQQITSAQGVLVEQAKGTLHLAKPKFRWEVTTPFPQIILANGNQVQIYDPDLEQVTEREINDSLDDAPLALLTQSNLSLDEHFAIAVENSNSGVAKFLLKPKSADALFAYLELVFSADRLSSLTIIDHTGQQTIIAFEKYDAQQVIQSSVFKLEFPPGTDFVRG